MNFFSSQSQYEHKRGNLFIKDPSDQSGDKFDSGRNIIIQSGLFYRFLQFTLFMKVIKMEPFLALFACSRSPFSLNDAVFVYGGAERMTSREGGRAQVHLIKTILFPCSPGLMRNRPQFMKQTITSAERARALVVSCCAGRAAGRVGTAVGVVRV